MKIIRNFNTNSYLIELVNQKLLDIFNGMSA